MAKIVAVANQKGASARPPRPSTSPPHWPSPTGACCWSTSTRREISRAASAKKGKRPDAGTIYDALTTAEPTTDARPFIIPTGVDRLSLIPADRNLTGAEIEMVPLAGREERLRALIAPVRGDSITSSSTARRRSAC